MTRFWDDVRRWRARNTARQQRLQVMGVWRNAIAHQDFASPAAVQGLNGKTRISLRSVRAFRTACDGLAVAFDAVVLAHIKAIAGPRAGW